MRNYGLLPNSLDSSATKLFNCNWFGQRSLLLFALGGLLFVAPLHARQQFPEQEKTHVAILSCAHPERDAEHDRSSWLGVLQGIERSSRRPVAYLNLGDSSHEEGSHIPGHQSVLDRALVSNELVPYGNKTYYTDGNHDRDDRAITEETGKAWIREATKSLYRNNKPYNMVGVPGRDVDDLFYIQIGNVSFIHLTDQNNAVWPWGRTNSPDIGGHPSGAIYQWQFAVLKNWVQTLPNPIVVSHHVPRDTVIASGNFDGHPWHGPSGISHGNGAMFSIMKDDESSAQNGTTKFVTQIFPHICAWIGGHTHAQVHEVDASGREVYAVVNGTPVHRAGFTTHFHAASETDEHWYLDVSFQEGKSEFELQPINLVTGEPYLDRKKVHSLHVPFTQRHSKKTRLDRTYTRGLRINEWNFHDPYSNFQVTSNQLVSTLETKPTSVNLTEWGVTEATSLSAKYSGLFIHQATMEFDGQQPFGFGIMGDKHIARFNGGSVQLLTTALREVVYQRPVSIQSGDTVRVFAKQDRVKWQVWKNGAWRTLQSTDVEVGFYKRQIIQQRRTSGSFSTNRLSEIFTSTKNYLEMNPVLTSNR